MSVKTSASSNINVPHTRQSPIKSDWQSTLVNFISMTAGAIMGAAAFIIFMQPFEIAVSGITGVAYILEAFFGTPLGLVTLLLNLPLLYLGYRMLPGGWQTIATTLYVVLVYSVSLDVLPILLNSNAAVSNDRLLNALFGGVLMGIGSGMIYRTGTTFGGTTILARILQRRTGMPMSSTMLYIDAVVIGAAGLTFGWEGALYALVVLFITGLATDYVMEGPSVIRTATIITNQPETVSQVIMQQLARGVTAWDGKGMYTGNERHILFVTVSRAQVADLKAIVTEVDSQAFIIIGQGHAAYGANFKPIKVKHQTGIGMPSAQN